MNPLQSFLERFQKVLTYPGQIKKDVLACFKKIAGISLEEKEIEIRSNVIYLKTGPAIKNAVFMHKQKLLKDLQECLGSKAPIDIR